MAWIACDRSCNRRTDSDGIFDHLDLDSDNDGITDNIEAQRTIGYVAPNADSNATYAINNGLNSAYLGTNGLTPVDTDSDGDADYVDTDSDNEGGNDAIETGSAAIATGLSNAGNDADGDGLFDVFENGSTNDGYVVNDGVTNPSATYADTDGDVADDNPPDADLDYRDGIELAGLGNGGAEDFDGDGVLNRDDIDDDNDGILDIHEGLPDYPTTGFTGTGISQFSDNIQFIQFDAAGVASLTTVGNYTQPVTLPDGSTVNMTVTLDTISPGDGLNAIPVGETRPANILFGQGPTPELRAIRNTLGGQPGALTYGLTFTFDQPIDLFVTDGEASGFSNINNTANTSATTDGSAFQIIDAINPNSIDVNGVGTNTVDFSPNANATSAATRGAYAFYTLDASTVSVTVTTNPSDLQGISIGIFQDRDGDGQHDYQDLDSDNDGISDLVESGNAAAAALDLDGNGTIALNEGGSALTADSDGDGLLDIFDQDNSLGNTATDSVGTIAIDTDGDGFENYVDLDSDADGIADAIEAFPTDGGGVFGPNYVSITSITDTDGDGVIDDRDIDANFGANFFVPLNDDDGDGTPDYIDTDSDGDGISDFVESGLTLSGADANNDGIDDDASIGASFADPDGTLDPAALPNTDSDTSDVDFRSVQDTDGDGIGDFEDIDDDNDGILDSVEGTGAVTFARDGNTPIFNGTTTIGVDVTVDVGPSPTFNPSSSNAKIDNSNFSFLTDTTFIPSTEVFYSVGQIDGLPDTITIDFSGEPVVEARLHFNSLDQFLLTYTPPPNIGVQLLSSVNTVVTSTATSISLGNDDFSSVDGSVADEELDGVGAGSADGTIRFYSLDGSPITNLTFDITEASGNTGNADGWQFAVEVAIDTDGDGIANHLDLDSDNDGISDLEESGSDATILDVNNNGVLDNMETPALAAIFDADGDGLLETLDNGNEVTPRQTDGDGIADFLDLDSDGDRIADAIEARPTSDGNVITSNVDSDGDGVIDHFDTGNNGTFGGNFSTPVDTDSATGLNNNPDGLADYIDTDSDGDGLLDINETGLSSFLDSNGDGIGDDTNFNISYADADGSLVPSNNVDNFTGDTSEVAYRELNVPPVVDLDDDTTGTPGVFDNTTTYLAGGPNINPIASDGGVFDSDSNGVSQIVLEFDEASFLDIANEFLVIGGQNIAMDPDSYTGFPGTTDFTVTANGNPYTVRVSHVPTAFGGPFLMVQIFQLPSQGDGDGQVPLADMNNLLHGIEYFNNVSAPTDGDRTFTVRAVSDQPAVGDSNTATATISVLDSPPIIDLNDDNTTPDLDFDVTYNEGDGQVNVADVDADSIDPNDNKTEVVINVSGVQDGSSEELTIAGQTFALDSGTILNGVVIPGSSGPTAINIVYSTGTGNIVITNAAGASNPIPQADLDILLRGIQYENTSQDPTAGDRVLSFTATDSGGNTTATPALSTITVVPDNDPPTVVTPLADQTSNDGDTTFTLSTAGAFDDIDDTVLTYSLGPSAPTWLQIDSATGEITINGSIPNDASQNTNILAGVPGTYDIPVVASDPDLASVQDVFRLTITNLDPVAVDDVSTGDEDNDQTGNVITDGVTGDADTAPDTDNVTVTAVTGGTVGTPQTLTYGDLTINGDGSWTFEPNGTANALAPGDTVQEVVTYTITDDDGGTDTATLTINITGVNDPVQVVDPNDPSTDPSDPSYDPTNPTVIPDPNNLIPDVSYDDGAVTTAIPAGDYFGDAEGDTLSFSAADLPPGLSIDPATGEITGTLDNSASQGGNGGPGIYDVTITATDPQGNTATTTVTYTITNLDPVAVDDVSTGDEDNDQTGNVITDGVTGDADTAPDTDNVTVTAVTGGTVGTPQTLTYGDLTINSDGSWTFEPNGTANALAPGDTVQEVVTYTITDDDGGTDTATLTINITGVNDPVQVVDPNDPSTDPSDPSYDPTNPTVIPDPNNLIPDVSYDDGAVTTAIPAGDYFGDAEGDTLSFSAADLPPGLSIDPATGEITGTLDNSASQGGNGGPGIYDVTITATDPQGNTATTTVTYTITNLDPVAVDDVSTGDEDNDQTGNVITDGVTGDADTAPDTDNVTVTAVTGGTVGTPQTLTYGDLTINSDGSWTFEPNGTANALAPGDTVQEVVTYTITDDDGGTDTATLTINITGVNDPVQVVDPNDPSTDPSDPSYDPTNPTVIPDPNNLIPDVSYDDGAVTTAIPAGDYFGDAEGDTLSFSAADLPPGLSIDPATGEITGTLDNSASQGGNGGPGIYDVTITATDPQGNTATTTVTYTITNLDPVAVDDVSTGDEDNDQTGNVITDGVTGDADTAPDTDNVTVTAVTGGTVGTPQTLTYGDLTINSDGSWTFEPNGTANALAPGDTVQEVVTYTITDDDGGTDTATLTINITGVNDPVQVVDPNDPSTDPSDPSYDPTNPTVIPDPNNLIPDVSYDDGAVTTAIPAGDYFGDAEGDTLSFSAADLPPGLSIDPATGEITGTLDNSASQGGNGGPGIYDVTITATDPQGNTATTTVTYTITNLDPVAVDDDLTIDEDTILTGDVFANNGNGTDGDGTPDSDDIFVSQVDGNASNVGQPVAVPTGGTFTINSDGSYSFDPGTDFQDLDGGEMRDTTITYQISDGEGGFDSAIVTVTVTGSNDGPVVIDPNDPFPDPNNPPVPGDPNNVIPDVTADDADTPPTLDVKPYFADVDDDVLTELTFTASNLPPGLAIDLNTGEITGTLDNSASLGGDDPVGNPGVYTVTITATDPEGLSVSTEVTYTISNPAPIAQDDDVTTDEDTVLNGDVFADNGNGIDQDPDGDDISVSQVDGNASNVGQPVAVPTGGTFTVNSDGTYSFDPGDDFNGLGVGESAQTSITYQISDGEGGFDQATITVTVSGVNDGPIPVDPSRPPIDPNNPPTGVPFDPQAPFEPPLDPLDYIPVQNGVDSTPFTSTDLNVFFGDPDTNDDVTLSIDPADLPPGLVFDPATGVISGTPNSDVSQGGNPLNPGTYSIPVTAEDPSGAQFTTNVTLVFTNPPPVVTTPIENFQKTVGDTFTTETADNFNDPDGDTLTYSAMGLPNGLTIDPATGTISGTVDPAAVVDAPNGDGVYTVTVTADDGQGGTVSTTFTFTTLDSFIPETPPPLGPESPESSSEADGDDGDDEQSSAILSALDEIRQEEEERRRIAAIFSDVDENGMPKHEYRGGHDTVATVAGNTVIRTMIYQDRVYLEVRSVEALEGWTLVADENSGISGWEKYEGSNLFSSLRHSDASITRVMLENEDLGVRIEILIDQRTGTFEVLEADQLEEDQAFNDGFSNQIRAMSTGHATEARALLKSLS